jgi:hypothetical protein
VCPPLFVLRSHLFLSLLLYLPLIFVPARWGKVHNDNYYKEFELIEYAGLESMRETTKFEKNYWHMTGRLYDI